MSKINVEHIRLLDLDLMENTSVTVIGDLMKLTPLLRTRTEYEKVTESIFDLRDEFEHGELYGDNTGVTKIETLAHLGACCQVGNVFRKVEKEIDWRDEVREFLESCKQISNSSQLESFTYKGGCSDKNVQIENELHDNEFLELCRVALRANGELE